MACWVCLFHIINRAIYWSAAVNSLRQAGKHWFQWTKVASNEKRGPIPGESNSEVLFRMERRQDKRLEGVRNIARTRNWVVCIQKFFVFHSWVFLHAGPGSQLELKRINDPAVEIPTSKTEISLNCNEYKVDVWLTCTLTILRQSN